jgi:hypothetical protein
MKKQIRKIYKRIKSVILSLFPSLMGETSREFRFYKESSGRWFVDLPEWKAAKWHLEMVEGADYVLDSFKSEHRNDVTLYVSLEHFDGAEVLEKSFDDPQGDGADYRYWDTNTKAMMTVWLCGVTEWYYGYMPDKIYFRKVLD